ncbi:MAG: ParB N-terminal domain-containing protein [Planctomycetota bacterium]
MNIRDRVRELRRVRAAELRPNPRNWRLHPPAQQDALRGVLAEIGFAGALLARELADGSLELIDGHLRAETAPETVVPVLVVDLDDAETVKLLAVHDPLAAMAETDDVSLRALLDEIETESESLEKLLADMLPPEPDAIAETEDGPPPAIDVPELYQVVVECASEAEQREVYERLTGEGLRCRLVSL